MFQALIEALDRLNWPSGSFVIATNSSTSAMLYLLLCPQVHFKLFLPVRDTIISLCSCQNALEPQPFPLMGRLARAINTPALTRLPPVTPWAILTAATAAAAEDQCAPCTKDRRLLS